MLKLYIDNLSDTSEFTDRLFKRLNLIDKNHLSVYDYDNISNENELSQGALSEKLEDFDIIIPIINPDYIVETESVLYELFDMFSKNENKYILPIIHSPANWSSIKWIVSNNIFPKDNKAIVELSKIEVDNILDQIVITVESIISQKNKYLNSLVTIDTLKNNQIFISHSHDDADFAELLKLNLEREGLTCWIDNEKLKVGQEWRNEIDLGVEKSIAVIVVMTPEAKKSEYVTYEWSFAWGKGKKIFPIMLKQTTLHPRLESLQYLDFTNRVTRPWNNLIDSLKKLEK